MGDVTDTAPMAEKRFIELRQLLGKWPTRPLTANASYHGTYTHVCDAYGNVVATVPETAGDFGARIVEALAVIPELLEEIGRLRPELVEASGNAAAEGLIRGYEARKAQRNVGNVTWISR